jgi:hypothetical protein
MQMKITFLVSWLPFATPLFITVACLTVPEFAVSSQNATKADQTARELPPLPLEPVFRLKPVDGNQRLITRVEFGFKKLQSELDAKAFRAVVTNDWPTGLVPLFAIEGKNGFELRRLPARGQENFSEPLFFALPPEHEPAAERIAGRWECVASREPNSKDYFAWELAVESEKVSGRFDQNTEYRYPYITAGSFRSNRLELRVEYIQDAYLLEGDWNEGSLSGKWRRSDDSEGGTWQATRESARPPTPAGGVALYEWRRAADGKRRYAVAGEELESGWERSPHPLCRVWPAEEEE